MIGIDTKCKLHIRMNSLTILISHRVSQKTHRALAEPSHNLYLMSEKVHLLFHQVPSRTSK